MSEFSLGVTSDTALCLAGKGYVGSNEMTMIFVVTHCLICCVNLINTIAVVKVITSRGWLL